VERFPVAFLEQAMEVRPLNDYRDQLVAERTSLLPAAPPREGPSLDVARRRCGKPTRVQIEVDAEDGMPLCLQAREPLER
jgi:hypothetical protein